MRRAAWTPASSLKCGFREHVTQDAYRTHTQRFQPKRSSLHTFGTMQTCATNATTIADALDRLPAHWLRHFAPGSVSYQQQRDTYFGLKGWGRTRFLIRRGKLLYGPAKGSTGCVLRRTPILAWMLLETLEHHPTLPDVSIPFNCRDKPTFWYPDGPQPVSPTRSVPTPQPHS